MAELDGDDRAEGPEAVGIAAAAWRDRLTHQMRWWGVLLFLFGIASCIWVATMAFRPLVAIYAVMSVLMGFMVILRPQNFADRRISAETKRRTRKP